MKKLLKEAMIALLCFTTVGFSACGSGGGASSLTNESVHECIYDQKVISEKFVKTLVSCKSPATYYYSCVCGEKGEQTFQDGKALAHDLTAEVIDEKYEVKKATCMEEGEYYKSCVNCGQQSYTKTFKTEKSNDHQFTQEVKDAQYLKEEATFETNAVYYKSCLCGFAGEDTFLGEKLKVYAEEEKIPYQPTSLTVSLYDSENLIYGFTYNTQKEPLRPVIQIREVGSEKWLEYAATVEKATTNLSEDYYISKVAIELSSNKNYEYRVYDKYVDIGTEIVTFNTKDVKAKSFTFIHVSDSQEYPAYFKDVLQQTVGVADFILHTGDIVQYSGYEAEWTAMLHDNFEYLSKIPMMAISGNHETTYVHCGANETYKHFHYKIPQQASTQRGLYYSFVYGDVKFIMLNTNNLDLTNKSGLESAQYNWLINELETNTSKWTIVSMHNPMYSVGKYGPNPSGNEAKWLQEQLQGVFAEYGVDIVLQGHDHCVSKTYPMNAEGIPQSENYEIENGISYSINPNGVVYLMNGTAGGQTRTPIMSDSSIYAYGQASNRSSWAEITVEGDKLTVSVKYFDGYNINVYHTWGIKKTTINS